MMQNNLGRENRASMELMPYHAVFGLLISFVASVLQIIAKGTTEPLFEAHRGNMWAIVVATITYLFALAADIKYKLQHGRSSQLLNNIAVISGSLPAVSLVSIILPHKFDYLIYIAWGFAVIIFVAYQNPILIEKVGDSMKKTSSKISEIWNGFKGTNTEEEQQTAV